MNNVSFQRRPGVATTDWMDYFLKRRSARAAFVFGALESHLPLTQKCLDRAFRVPAERRVRVEVGWSQHFNTSSETAASSRSQ